MAQLLKVLYELLKRRRLDLGRMVGAGGMPSSHSAFVTALTASVGHYAGWDSAQAAICLVFSLIVLYDAAGVRRAVGKQASILNQMIEHHGEGTEKGRLKELLGHTPVEVFAGAALGVFFALFWIKFLGF